jgi:Na+/H+ antiporter NhaC
MSGSQNETEELKSYADGWMTERKGTDVPGFLKLAFPVIGLGCVAYLVLQMSGDIHNADRGKFVQQFNKVSHDAPAMSYLVAALALVYVITVVAFAVRTFKED